MAPIFKPVGGTPGFEDGANGPDAGAGSFFSAPVAPTSGIITTPASPSMTLGGAQMTGNNISYDAPPVASTDYSSLIGSGVQAAGGAVAGIAQAAAQQAALQQQAAQSSAGNALSEKLAKLQLGQSASQFAQNQKLQALMWELSAGKAANATAGASRDIRRQDEQMLSDVLSHIYMPRK